MNSSRVLEQASIVYDPPGPGEMIKEEPWSEFDTANELSPQYTDLSLVSIKQEVEDYVEVKEEVWNAISALGSLDNADKPTATADSNRSSGYSSETQELVFEIKEDIKEELIVVDLEENPSIQVLNIADGEQAERTGRRAGLRNRSTMKSRILIKDGRVTLIDDDDNNNNIRNPIHNGSKVKPKMIKQVHNNMVQNTIVQNPPALKSSNIAIMGEQVKMIQNKRGRCIRNKVAEVKISSSCISTSQNVCSKGRTPTVKRQPLKAKITMKEGRFKLVHDESDQVTDEDEVKVEEEDKDEDDPAPPRKQRRRPGPLPKDKKCRYCGAGPFKEGRSLIIHEYSHTGTRPFTCEYCGLSYKDVRYLRIHKRMHTGERPYKCDYCPETFGRAHHLICHRRIHTGEKPYSCKYCSATFRVSYVLKIHERKHTGEKPYPCEFCEASFKELGDLKSHKRSHTGERPYLCKICNRRFSQSTYLTKHMRLHSGERPFGCEQCKMKFRSRELLIVHIRKHTGDRPYACKICGTAFYTIGGVKQHQRVHSSGGQFKCDICGGKFKRKNHLTLHRRSHIGEFPYECKPCGIRFHLLYDFDIHKRSHKKRAL